MSAWEVIYGIVSALAINEVSELSPWAARKIVRWSTHLRYQDGPRARVREEELAAVIDSRPGKLFKLITAIGFAVTALKVAFVRYLANYRPLLSRGPQSGSSAVLALRDNLVYLGALLILSSALLVVNLIPPVAPAFPEYPSAADWKPFGSSTEISSLPNNAVQIKPGPRGQYTDEWFGAVLPIDKIENYVLTFKSDLTRPTYAGPPEQLGYGFGIGARANLINGLPTGSTVQYDPPFMGLRIVSLPLAANTPGLDARFYGSSVASGIVNAWKIVVNDEKVSIFFDGRYYQTFAGAAGDDILVRVWNAKVILSDMKISPAS